MKIPKYSDDEKNVIGSYKNYPSIKGMYNEFGFELPDTEPRYNRPVTPRENFLRLLEGKKPYWLPFAGANSVDIRCFMPRQIPDNYVTHLVNDGGNQACSYPSLILKSSWFDLEWEFMPAAGGATVHPGNPKLTDMSEWEKYFEIPSIDSVDWESLSKDNLEYVNTDKLVILNILSGPWERLMSLMDVENAAVALIDEEQHEGLHRFLDQYCTFLDEYIGHVKDAVRIDGVLMHDDWGHQNGPFFSRSTAEEIFLPYLKRIVESCHKRGLFYEQHSCGRNETFIDMYIEAGVNLYCPQDINDFDMLLDMCEGTDLIIGVPLPNLPFEMPYEKVYEVAEQWFDHYKEKRFAASSLVSNPALNSAVYEISRKEYSKESVPA